MRDVVGHMASMERRIASFPMGHPDASPSQQQSSQHTAPEATLQPAPPASQQAAPAAMIQPGNDLQSGLGGSRSGQQFRPGGQAKSLAQSQAGLGSQAEGSAQN